MVLFCFQKKTEKKEFEELGIIESKNPSSTNGKQMMFVRSHFLCAATNNRKTLQYFGARVKFLA